MLRLFWYKILAMSYSHMGTPTLPSAMLHFTSEFEMGSGGSIALLSPENWLLRTDYSVLRLTFGNMNHQSLDCCLIFTDHGVFEFCIQKIVT